MSLAWLLVTQAFVYHITRYPFQYCLFLSSINLFFVCCYIYDTIIQLSSVAKCGKTLAGGFPLLYMGVQVSRKAQRSTTIDFHPSKQKSSYEMLRLHCFHKVAHHQSENLFAGCGQLSECPRSIQRLIFALFHYKPTYTAPASMCLINRMLKTSPPSTPMSSQLQRWLAGSKLERQRWER